MKPARRLQATRKAVARALWAGQGAALRRRIDRDGLAQVLDEEWDARRCRHGRKLRNCAACSEPALLCACWEPGGPVCDGCDGLPATTSVDDDDDEGRACSEVVFDRSTTSDELADALGQARAGLCRIDQRRRT